jgi:hypothetical protein
MRSRLPAVLEVPLFLGVLMTIALIGSPVFATAPAILGARSRGVRG